MAAMSDDELKRHAGGAHQGDEHTSPYPVSRLAPAIDLVDLAKEIARADTLVNTRVSAKLKVIADQIKALQAEARTVLEEARQDQALHRAECNFKRLPGKVYHLYQKQNGALYFSMLSPQEWGSRPPHAFVGSYRLENDMSWTPAERIGEPDDTKAIVQRLLGDEGP